MDETLTEKDKARFWRSVQPGDPASCWEWLGCKNQDGYGLMTVGGRSGSCMKTHRVSYLIKNGTINAACVLHTCDNPACVNPGHLVEGSQVDNIKDMFNKGRRPRPRGALNGRALLTTEQVVWIKEELQRGASGAHLGRLLGVTRTQISAIKRGKAWSHVQIP